MSLYWKLSHALVSVATTLIFGFDKALGWNVGMDPLLLLEMLLALAGPVVWLGWYRRARVGPMEFGMLLWVLYGASAVLGIFFRELHSFG